MIKNSIFLFSLIISVPSVAQINDSTDLQLENVEVVKQFKTRLIESKIIAFTPPIIPEKEKEERLNLNYSSNPPKTLEVNIPDPEIRTLAYVEENSAEDAYNGYAKLGYGNLKSLDILGHYHYYIEDWFEVGLKGNYYSATDNLNPAQKVLDTGLGFYASYFLNDHTKVKADFNGSWDKAYAYKGITDQSVFLEEDIKKNLNNYSSSVSISHVPFDQRGISLNTKLFYDHFNLSDSLYKESEIGIENIWGIRFGDEKSSGIYLNSSIKNYNNGFETDTSLMRFSLNPFLVVETDLLSGQLGIYYDNQDVIWPHSNIQYKLDSNISINLSSGVETQLNNLERINRINQFWNLSAFDINQYANKKISIATTYQKNNYDIRLDFSRNDHKNFVFFSNSSESNYTENFMDLEEYSIKLSGNYELTNWLLLGLNVDKKILNWENERNPDYLSDLLANINMSQILLNNKIVLHQSFHYANSRPYLNFNDNTDQSLDYMMDINLSVDFNLLKQLKLYGEFNNILNRRFDLWDGYESFGFNFHGGLKIIL